MLVTVLFGCVMEFTFNFIARFSVAPRGGAAFRNSNIRSLGSPSLRRYATPQLEPRCFAAKIHRLLKKHDPRTPAVRLDRRSSE